MKTPRFPFLTGWPLALALVLMCLARPAAAAEQRLVLVTIDGLSWTDVFRGADAKRAGERAFVEQPEAIRGFVSAPDRAAALMPFLHGMIARQGVLVGDRDHGSCAAVANDRWFSYPGYNEILTGRTDPTITSNNHGPNRNVTFLEWLNRRPDFRGRVAAVASWSVFHDIINDRRSGVAVDAGWESRPSGDPILDELERTTPHLWPTARFDAFTQARALRTLRRDKPRVLYVAFNDTDDFAHEGHYDQVLLAAHRADSFVAALWRAIQADPAYAGHTTLIVTADHGRGTEGRETWRHHGKPLFVGSDAVWIGAIGPGIRAFPAPPGSCASSSQIAATALNALSLDWRAFDPAAGRPLAFLRGP